MRRGTFFRVCGVVVMVFSSLLTLTVQTISTTGKGRLGCRVCFRPVLIKAWFQPGGDPVWW